MSKFISNNSHPPAESTKMSVGECFNRIKDNELIIPDYQRDYVWSTKQQQGYLDSLSRNMPLYGPVINVNMDSGIQEIMDGQNRIMTIYKFLNDEIKFRNENDELIIFSEFCILKPLVE